MNSSPTILVHLQPHLLHLCSKFISLGRSSQHLRCLVDVHLNIRESLGFDPSSKVGESVGVNVGVNVGVKVLNECKCWMLAYYRYLVLMQSSLDNELTGLNVGVRVGVKVGVKVGPRVYKNWKIDEYWWANLLWLMHECLCKLTGLNVGTNVG